MSFGKYESGTHDLFGLKKTVPITKKTSPRQQSSAIRLRF